MTEQIEFVGRRSLRWLQEGDCLVIFLEAKVKFTDELWDQWLEVLADSSWKRCLLCTGGDVEFSKEQWKRATQAMRKATRKFAAVSDSKAFAAQAKAASWLGIEMKSFRWDKLYNACEFVELAGESGIVTRRKAIALRDRFGEKVDSSSSSSSSSETRSSPSPFRPASPAPSSRPTRASRPSAPSQRVESAHSPSPSRGGSTPMADAAARNLEEVRKTSEDTRARLAAIQAKLRASRTK